MTRAEATRLPSYSRYATAKKAGLLAQITASIWPLAAPIELEFPAAFQRNSPRFKIVVSRLALSIRKSRKDRCTGNSAREWIAGDGPPKNQKNKLTTNEKPTVPSPAPGPTGRPTPDHCPPPPPPADGGGALLLLLGLLLSAPRASAQTAILGTTNLVEGPAAGTDSVVLGSARPPPPGRPPPTPPGCT